MTLRWALIYSHQASFSRLWQVPWHQICARPSATTMLTWLWLYCLTDYAAAIKQTTRRFFSYWRVCILMLMTCQWKLVQIQDWMLVWKPVYNHLYVELPFILLRNIDLTFTSIWWTRSASKYVLHELSCAELVSGMLHCAKRLSEAMRAFCQWAHCKRHCDFSENGNLLL